MQRMSIATGAMLDEDRKLRDEFDKKDKEKTGNDDKIIRTISGVI